MSYNISKCTIKRLENLVIPLEAFFRHERADWHPTHGTIPDFDNPLEIVLECGCEQTIAGKLEDGKLRVKEMHLSGEGSGTFYSWILAPALKESSGILEAVLVWEGGDSISRLKVENGNVEDEEIEL
jgi:hypothetical protein